MEITALFSKGTKNHLKRPTFKIRIICLKVVKREGETTLGWGNASIKWKVTWEIKDLGDSEHALIKANPLSICKKKKKVTHHDTQKTKRSGEASTLVFKIRDNTISLRSFTTELWVTSTETKFHSRLIVTTVKTFKSPQIKRTWSKSNDFHFILRKIGLLKYVCKMFIRTGPCHEG